MEGAVVPVVGDVVVDQLIHPVNQAAQLVDGRVIGHPGSDVGHVGLQQAAGHDQVVEDSEVFGTIGAFDTALWDIKAQAAGEPLWRLLGGRDPRGPAYASGLDIGLTDDELVATYEAYGQLTWIEEPVRRWDADGLAVASRGVHAAVASGENLTGLEQFRPLIAAGGLDIVQTAAVWGVTHFLRVAALAHTYDLPIGSIGNTPVALLHAATSVPNHIASELQDLQPPTGVAVDLHVEDGAFVLGESPGLSIEVDETAITAVHDGRAPVSGGPHVRPEQAGRRLVAFADRGGVVQEVART